jgi:ABC-type Fe3+ transport system substrate-binding protein
MGKERGKAFLTQLARQQPQVRSGHNLLAQLLTAGEFALAPTARVHRVEDARREGAPVNWFAIEPLAPEPPVCVSLPKNAPRPSAGKLFIDFILSAEAQEILYNLKRIPSRVDAPQPIPELAKIKLLEIEHDENVKDYAAMPKNTGKSLACLDSCRPAQTAIRPWQKWKPKISACRCPNDYRRRWSSF